MQPDPHQNRGKRYQVVQQHVEPKGQHFALVQVGHASDVGEDTLLCAQVGLAGSSKIGRSVILTGQVGVAGHLEIGDRVIATAQTGIPNSIEPDKVVSGYPAIDNKLWLKSSAIFKRLPELLKRIEALEKKGN